VKRKNPEVTHTAAETSPPAREPDPPADTGADGPVALLAASEVVAYLAQQRERCERVLSDLAADKAVSEPDLRFAVEVLGPTFDGKLVHVKAVRAADLLVIDSERELREHVEAGERLALALQRAATTAECVAAWSWNEGDGSYRFVQEVIQRANGRRDAAASACRRNQADETLIRARLLERQRARAALDG
jgi:hypothetical protein